MMRSIVIDGGDNLLMTNAASRTMAYCGGSQLGKNGFSIYVAKVRATIARFPGWIINVQAQRKRKETKLPKPAFRYV